MVLVDISKLDTRERGNNSQRAMWWNIQKVIEEAPKVEVITCSECERREHEVSKDGEYFCPYHEMMVKLTDFCAWGKKGGTDE